MIITIDGPTATGKSTIAKKLASSIGYIFYDTGAMYRMVALEMMRKKVPLEDEELLKTFLRDFECTIKVIRGERKYLIGEEDVTNLIRTEDVSKEASRVSKSPLVREKLVALQRKLAQGVNAVFEGRDMGTVVFPDAALKIFLTASDDIRAKRRLLELQERFPDQTFDFETVKKEMLARDEQDRTRAISPLVKAADAFEIDTSDLSLDEVNFRILECKDLAAQKRKAAK
jgi:CMP/dCMP kinase